VTPCAQVTFEITMAASNKIGISGTGRIRPLAKSNQATAPRNVFGTALRPLGSMALGPFPLVRRHFKTGHWHKLHIAECSMNERAPG
jgi:hypothetical protein